MRSIISFTGSLLVWTFCILVSIPLFLVALVIFAVTTPFDPRGVILHQYSCLWASMYIWVNPFWRIRMQGREHIKPGTPYMIISNHQSLVDILVLYRLFKHFKWVAKAELYKIPVFGWHMALNRYIKLSRMDRKSQFQMLKTSIRTLQSGSSVLIFPEGTRTPDGELKRFKEGAFAIAKKAGVAIIPIVINGSFNAMPKKSFMMHRVNIQVEVLPEIPAETVAEKDTRELAEYSRELIAARLP
ncbi:MAG: lysophospholipid acyltransferase family protein [Spirochaeta sp.]